MNTDKLRLLANGIASIADALDTPFLGLIEDMETIGILDEEGAAAVIEYAEGL